MGGSARIVAIPDLRAWCDAVTGLAASGPLPSRTVLVPSEDVAHALRRRLVSEAPSALLGTRFLTPPAAASAVLEHAQVKHTAGEDRCRKQRVRALLGVVGTLETLQIDPTMSLGWCEAIASSIAQLEAACIGPGDLAVLSDGRARDVARLWRALEDDAGNSWTLTRTLREAAQLLRQDPRAWPFRGETLTFAALGVDRAHAEFIASIPRAVQGVMAARPCAADRLARFGLLMGEEASEALTACGVINATDELGVLQSFLFSTPQALADRGRRTSAGPDGSVTLEQHGGVDDEIEAAARWVAEEVFERGTPLHEIAVLFANADPYAAILAERIRSLEWPEGAAPVYVACGVPATTHSAGARLLAVVSALRNGMPADALVELLPRFRLVDEVPHLTPGKARKVIRELATLGGTGSRPEGAREWRMRLHRAERSAATAAVAPAIEAMVAITEMNGTLASVWRAIRAFFEAHVIGSDVLEGLLAQITGELDELVEGGIDSELRGVDALIALERLVRESRVHEGRYGEPRVYVGTISSAASLEFTAVRVIGLVEGVFPGIQKDDAVLSSRVRATVGAGMASDADYIAGRLHAFYRVVRGTRERLSLSAPRTFIDGSEREPAAVFVDVATALARPGGSGILVPIVRGPREIERDGFLPSRAASQRRLEIRPLTRSSWLERTAASSFMAPYAWRTGDVVDPALVATKDGTSGELGGEPLTVTVYGVTPVLERALSYSALRDLLQCPRRFLLQRMIGLRPRDDQMKSHALDAMSFGYLVHLVVETFLREHGGRFAERLESLAHWNEIIENVAAGEFESHVAGTPLRRDMKPRELRRLHEALAIWAAGEWNGRAGRFVDVEREFGVATPVSIDTSSGPLFVRGRIDHLAVEEGVTFVKDLKTGRAHPRAGYESGPSLNLDLQLALYALVTRSLASGWGLPSAVAGEYTYLDPFAGERHRSFSSADADELLGIGQEWVDAAASLLREQSFPRTSDPDDCRYCAYRPVCVDQADGQVPRSPAHRAWAQVRGWTA